MPANRKTEEEIAQNYTEISHCAVYRCKQEASYDEYGYDAEKIGHKSVKYLS